MDNTKKTEEEDRIYPNRIILAILYALVPIAVGISAFLYVQQEGIKLINEFRFNTEIEGELNSLMFNVQTAETGQRGYLLTANESYLEPYNLAVQTSETIFQKILTQIGSDSTTFQQLQQLERLSEDKFSELTTTIQLKRNEQDKAALELINTDIGKLKMDSIRTIINGLKIERQNKLFTNADELNQLQYLSRLIIFTAASIVIGIFIYVYLFVRPVLAKIEQRNKEIIAERKLVEAKNKELEHFAYITSHDLKEPSRTIAGFIDAFEEDYAEEFDAGAQQYFQFIKNAAQRMNDMINGILSFSRLGESESLAEVDLNETVSIVKKDLSALINNQNAVIESQTLPTITAKGALIQLLLQNLITNAIKFKQKDASPVVRITYEEKPDFWQFSVIDNGIGISPDMQKKIFNFFTKLHLASEYEGQGIGLAFCKKIVELHKGHIEVRSTLGEGSTFIFTVAKHLSAVDQM